MGEYARTPSVFQMEMTECGAAALCMVLAYYGCHVPLEKMRVETGVSRDGCNMKGIKRAAIGYGLEVHVYRREPDELKDMKVPGIIHWNFNHFVVFEGFRGNYAYINDPAYGRRKLTLEELDEGFTGVIMTFEKTERFRENKKRSTVLSFAAGRMKGYGGVLFQMLCAGLLLAVPGVLFPMASRVFVDDVLLGKDRTRLAYLLALMGGCVLFKVVLSYCRILMQEKLKTRMTLMSAKDFLRHMFRLPAGYFDQRYAGDLVSRMISNAEVSAFLAGDLVGLALDLITAGIFLAALILISPALTLVCGVKALVCLIAVAFSAGALKDAAIRLQMSGGKVNGVLSAGLSITDSIKASGVEMEYGNRILGYQAQYAGFEQALMRRQKALEMIPEAMDRIVDVLLLCVGGVLVIRGRMTIGMLVAYRLLYGSFCVPVDNAVGFFHGMQRLRANISRVEDVEKHEVSDCFAHRPVRPMTGKLKGNVELRGVSFGYSVIQPPVVEDLDFSLSSGETIAFVGPSGCGKSTVSKVISGLYSPREGEVLFDGIPLPEIPRAVFSNSVASVSQEIHLFSGTIRDNLTMWDPTVLEEDIDDAAKDACIYDFIMRQPLGYDFRIDEGARNLSGGQRQRLEIARALAQRPSILLMDEATSALDPLVEKKIMENIRRRGCTCIVVAHRLSAIRDCSQIVVMDKGRIVERGTHGSLMRARGFYAALMGENRAFSRKDEGMKGGAQQC